MQQMTFLQLQHQSIKRNIEIQNVMMHRLMNAVANNAPPAAPAAQPLIPPPQPVVGHVTAAMVAGQIQNPTDAQRETEFLKTALLGELQQGQQPWAHLLHVPLVQAAARDHGPAHAP